MKLRSGRMPLMITTLVLSALCFTLRRLQLAYSFDALGLPIRGSWLTFMLCAVCALGVLLLLLGCRGMQNRPEFARSFSPCSICFGVSLVSAALLLVGSGMLVWGAMPMESILQVLPGFLGVVCALCVMLAAAGKYKNAQPMTALYLLPFFFAAVKLVLDFKDRWSTDPVLMDYCFELLGMIAAMTALYHLAGFCFDRGRRARTSFWCLTAAVLCLLSLADGGLANMLIFAGLALWLLVNAWQLLGPDMGEAQPEETE